MGLFAHCSRCNRRCLKSALNSEGFCRGCEAALRNEELQKTMSFISELSTRVNRALEHTVILPHMGAKAIDAIYKECLYLDDHLDEWTEYPLFKEAFDNGLKPYDGMRGHYYHDLFRNTLIGDLTPIDFQSEFEKLKKSISDIETQCMIARNKAYDYSELFSVVGVTFANDDGTDRQDIIKRMGKGYKDNDSDKVRLEEHTFNGEPAIAVFFGKNQIGNIPKAALPLLLKNWRNYFRVVSYEVSGYDTLGIIIRVAFRGEKP